MHINMDYLVSVSGRIMEDWDNVIGKDGRKLREEEEGIKGRLLNYEVLKRAVTALRTEGEKAGAEEIVNVVEATLAIGAIRRARLFAIEEGKRGCELKSILGLDSPRNQTQLPPCYTLPKELKTEEYFTRVLNSCGTEEVRARIEEVKDKVQEYEEILAIYREAIQELVQYHPYILSLAADEETQRGLFVCAASYSRGRSFGGVAAVTRSYQEILGKVEELNK